MTTEPDTLESYRRLTETAAAASLGSSVVQMTGEDRLKFLHNFCTNEIKALGEGKSCEAFILNGKGKTIAHVQVLHVDGRLLLVSMVRAGDGSASTIIDHLDHYLMRDKVMMEDVSQSMTATFVAGPDSQGLLESKFGELLPVESQAVAMDETSGAIVADVELAGWGYLVLGGTGGKEWLDIPTSDAAALHMLRVKQRTPWFGIDINDSNLPQELLRDEKVINFNKGCYLGQETVARIDAIGRVNRVIAPVKLTEEMTAGAQLTKDDKSVGTLTSTAWSPDLQAYIGLAMLRRPLEAVGSIVAATSPEGKPVEVTVIS